MPGKRRAKALEAEALERERKAIGSGLNFASAEAFKRLRTNIVFALPHDKSCRVLGVTSSVRGEGKSTTALNLAYMLAEAGEWVLLMEADMRLPTVARRLEVKRSPGLSNLLAGVSCAEDVVQSSGLSPQMRVVTAGDLPPNPSELLSSRQMGNLVEEFGRDFSYIIIDLPPVTAVTDALIVSKLTDGLVMAVRQNYATRRELDDAMRQLEYAQAKILGFVMTDAAEGSQGGKYGRYNKNYKQ